VRPEITELFELDPGLTHLNHGAFGAVPRAVREAQDRARARIEAAPMRAFRDQLPGRIAAVRVITCGFLGVPSDSTALVRNVSEGVSVVLEALSIGVEDHVVVSNHGYPTASMAVQARGASTQVASFPVDASQEDVVEAFAAAVTPATRLVIVDQVTSPTALLLPVARVAEAVAPVPVLVDAAHVPGAVPGVRVDGLRAAFWVGNLHKWSFAPRSVAALWVASPYRDRVRPLVTSWNHAEPFPASFDLQGTVDHSAWLALPEAFDFWERLGGWQQVVANAQLLREGADHVTSALGTESPLGGIPSAPCMSLVALPKGVAAAPEEADALWQQLYAAGFVVPPVSFEGRGFLRLAAQVYNDEDDYARLAAALAPLVGAR
jgi:isopenicillin-N epimerase